MKKKTVSLLLVAAMAVGMLAGCGGGKSSISQDGSSDAAEGNEKAEIPSSEIGLLSQVALQWKYGHKKKQTSSKR